MSVTHKNLAHGGWQKMTLAEQLGNVGSEVSRAASWKIRDPEMYQKAIGRAYELLNLTVEDPRWKERLREILRVREMMGDATSDGKEFGATLEELDRYFLQFAIAAQLIKLTK